MKEKTIVIFVIIILISICAVPVFAATKTELQQQKKKAQDAQTELKEEKQDIQEEKKDVLAEVSSLTNQIASLEKEIDEVKDSIKEIETSISQKEKTLEETNSKLKEKEDLLAKRLVAMYVSGDTTYLDFILNGGFIDFMSNYYLVVQIAEYDTNLISEVEEERESITKEKETLEGQKVKLNEQKATLFSKNNTLEQSKSKKEKVAANLTAEEKEVQSKIDEYYASEKRLEAQLLNAEKKGSSNSNLKFTGGTFKWPCPASYNITSYFGYREQPVPGASTYHRGIDIAASTGTAIVAAADGEVSVSTRSSAEGNYVMINHGSGVYTVYMHASQLNVSVGQSVKAGQTIALVGSTGYSSGPHLHFGVRINGSYVNPMNYFSR